ncbi:MAG: tetratricopeptide repeat protein [Bacteroidota bacterium]
MRFLPFFILVSLFTSTPGLGYRQPSQDTTTINRWNQYAEDLRYQDTPTANLYLDSALQLSERIAYLPGQGQAHLNLGTNAIILGDIEKSTFHTQQALSVFETLAHPIGVADANKNLGVLAYFTGEYQLANDYYQEALKIFLQLDDTQGQAKCYANIGLTLSATGEYDSALNYFMQALQCDERLGNQEAVANDYVYLAQVYQYTNDLDAALRYQKKALAIFEATNNQVRQSLLLNDIGKTYHQQQNWSEALDYYQQAIKLQKQLNNEREMGIMLANIGSVYEELQQFSQAESHYRQALVIAQKLNDNRNIPALLLNLAELAFEENDYNTSMKYLSQAITSAKELGQKSDLQRAHDLLHQVYEVKDDYQQALQQYRIARVYQDSLFNEEKSEQIAELQTKYEVEKKEQQIASQEQKITLLAENERIANRFRVVLLVALGLLVVLILFVYSRYRLKQRSAQLLSEKNQEIQSKNEQIHQMNQELEKRMLRAQMDPHFIFNSLNSIQHLITINDKTSSLKYLSKFSKLVRRVLENSVNTQVPLADEITLLKHYIELEQLRYNHSFEYSIDVDDSVDVHDTEIPFLLIQPYVENALVHGLRYKPEGGKLKIELKQKESDLWCIVEDNGVGRKKAKRHKQQSTLPSRGMSVTQQRLETLNVGKTRRTSVRILDLTDEENQPQGTQVEIIVPLTEESCSVPLS